MSKIIAQSLEGGVLHAFSLANEFVKICPDKIWAHAYGRWPVWQQLYHAFSAVDFFVRPKDAPESMKPVADGIGNLTEEATEAASKEIMQKFFGEAQAEASKYMAALDDAALAQKNEGLSARMGRDITHAGTIALLAAHTMYHLGACDAALRENGLPGVF